MRTQIKLTANLENMNTVLAFIHSSMEEYQFDAKSIYYMEVAAEEMYVNICRYAYPGATGEMEARFSFQDNAAVFTFIDWGIPFNPLEHALVEFPGTADEREEGGLGIFMAKKYTSSMDYRREEDANILTMTKQKAEKKE